ncbi:hypothetical protein [Caulobacter segnis]|uniref:Uncharacterized protein n=1 Tax=Caulobacter segnis TaxID=88688 RepID=A0A2W5UZR4_9CAUL|nr:hypothetical protein [Caulobacter segnis]PZR33120.1 MAG: hypothetical protein DI526_14575 [Caulobacter segnis]
MAWGKQARRWLAVSGGLMINGLLLGALIMLEPPPLMVDETPVLMLDLERASRSRAATSASRSRPARRLASSRPDAAPIPSAAAKGEGGSAQSTAETPPGIEERWRLDSKAIDRWKLTEGVPEWRWGRYYRACKGLSNEHIAPEEKDRCYGGWSGRKDRRPSPAFIGPIDETRWETLTRDSKSRFEREGDRKQRCRDYWRGRTPGFSERNLSSTGAPPPSLREGGCF